MAIRIEGRIPKQAELRVIPLPGDADPLMVAQALAGRPGAAALSGSWFGGGTILATDPTAWITGGGPEILDVLDDQPAVSSAADSGTAGPLGGGFLGGLGYHALDPSQSGRAIAMAFHDHLLRHSPGTGWSIEMLWTPERAFVLAEALRRSTALVAGLPRAGVAGADCPGPGEFAQLVDVTLPDRDAHLRAVRRCQELIAAGRIYQANICTALSARLVGAPIALWAQLIRALGPAYGAYVPTAAGVSVGASPELFLRRTGRSVATSPIKGTRPRSDDPAIDAAMRRELAASVKDRAENVMIADLMRNDLGRVAATGSVRATRLLALEPGAGVWHLVSSIEATLRERVGDGALLGAAFPPGSVTGAPKVAARAVIDALESRPRDLYTGAVGLLSPIAGTELAVVIRTFEISGSAAHLGIGGGITEGSDPGEEYAECLVKAAPLLLAGGLTLGPVGIGLG
jgi:para-aminobenzoate synthetase/4-amino-4-deoxychorismate lyase